MAQRWFEKFVGCCFGINGKEYIFSGTFLNTETKNGLPLQYVFESTEEGQYMADYKEARQIMGSMIDKYYKK